MWDGAFYNLSVAIRLTAPQMVLRVATVVFGWRCLDYSFIFKEALGTGFEVQGRVTSSYKISSLVKLGRQPRVILNEATLKRLQWAWRCSLLVECLLEILEWCGGSYYLRLWEDKVGEPGLCHRPELLDLV